MNGSMKTCKNFQNKQLPPQKNVIFIIGDWNAKVGSQEILEITDKFGLGVQNEADKG